MPPDSNTSTEFIIAWRKYFFSCTFWEYKLDFFEMGKDGRAAPAGPPQGRCRAAAGQIIVPRPGTGRIFVFCMKIKKPPR